MQRRYIVSLVFMLAVASVLYLVMSKNKPLEVILEKATSVIIKSENKKMVIPSLKSVSEGNKNNSKVAALEKEDSLFPEYQLLNKQELEKYKVVPAQIVKYFDWGKMDENQIEEFRQNVWEFGDRGIATIANELNNISSEKAKLDNIRAQELISYVDLLRYFAQVDSQSPLSKQAVEKLALRQVEWNNEGQLKDSQKAGITFECFQIFASLKPEAAEQFIAELEDANKAAYIYNYVLGRKLGKMPQETAIAHAKEIFGIELVGKALNAHEKI